MKIDTTIGSFTVDEEVILSPRLTRSAFLASALGKSARQEVRHEPWLTLSFDVPGEPVSACLLFEGERLRTITFAHRDSRFGTSWADWTEAAERARADETMKWLMRQGLEASWYPWGEIEGLFDPKGGSGYAAVTYTQSP